MKGDGIMGIGISLLFLSVFSFSINSFLAVSQIILGYFTISLGDEVRSIYIKTRQEVKVKGK